MLQRQSLRILRMLVRHFFIWTFLVLLATTVSARTVKYVSDQVPLPVRSGTSLQHRIIEMVKSGTPVEVIETEQQGYFKIRLPSGEEGFMLSRYLMDQPSARDRLGQLEPRLEELRETNSRLREREQTLSSEFEALQADNQKLLATTQALQAELEDIRRASARALELRRENQRLTREVEQHQQSLHAEKEKNERLQANSDRKWFITGAIVTLLSLFFGLIIPRIPWRRRRRWGDL